MQRTKIAQLFADVDAFGGKEITVAGWVRSVRDMKNFGFVTLNDGSCFRDLQVVMSRETLENYDEIAAQNVSAALICKGTLKLTPEAQQPFELTAESISVEGVSAPDYPLQKKRATVEFLRTQQHLRPRTNLFRAVFRIRSIAAASIHSFFQDRGFVYVNTPIITASDCEGAGEMFRVTTQPWTTDAKTEEEYFAEDFFGRKAGLTVSAQLEGEMAAMGLGRIYTFGPTFRAEHSNTTRHAAEFWQIEPEVCFADINDIIGIAEDFIKSIIRSVLENCPDEMAFFDQWTEKGIVGKLTKVINSDFGRIDYTDAVKLLEESGRTFKYPVSWGCDLQTEHEKYLTDEVFGKPLFVVNYPKDIKAFYMKQNPDGKTVAATDLLVPGIGEIIGCSEREADYDKLAAAMTARNMPLDAYRQYLDTRRFGTVPHSGFGLGFERMVMYVTGMSNIRDTALFPRTVGSL